MQNDNIFSGLEELGFNNTPNLKLFKEEEKNILNKSEEKNEKSLLYERTVECPVCYKEFKSLALRSNAYKAVKKDSDLFIHYDLINPYFYDVWVCNHCGYSSLKSDFEKIGMRQAQAIKENITPRWKAKSYPDVYDVTIAIERYKLALLNYMYMDAKDSQKAMTCLKIAWMYRINTDSNSHDNEITFLKQALTGFENAFFNESFPIYSMDKFTAMYLMGDINRRLGDFDSALSWYSKVITAQGAKPKVKDLARDQRDLVKSELNKQNPRKPDESKNSNSQSKSKRSGFLSKLNPFK